MALYRAAMWCPQCPSDTADVEFIRDENGITIGLAFTCILCDLYTVLWH